MSVALFITVEAPGGALSDADLDDAAALLRSLPGIRQALAYRPVEQTPEHPFAADGAGPALAIELRFGSLAEAEAALSPDRLGHLPLPPEALIAHQVFAARDFRVLDPEVRGGEPCTFLVRYPGPAADPEAWLDHYDANHPPIMVRFPGIRAVATYRPIAWRSELPWARDTALQRNKVVFDSPEALAAALASPVMAEMRADRDGFPPFAGGATHFPMRTRVVV